MSRPLLILQPAADDGPAYLAHWLREAGLAFERCQVQAGDAVPVRADRYAGLAVLGGSMSVHDDLPFLHSSRQLLRDALAQGRPVLGHCLGGQLLAQVLGAEVQDNPVPEIGWSRVTRHTSSPLAQAWLGNAPEFPAFQWHFQTFGLPAGATWLAGNAHCPNQAFAQGPNLGMQFHIEVDAEKLSRWQTEAPPDASPLRRSPSVQGEAAMQADTARHLAHSQRVAAGIYARWVSLAGLR